MQEIICIHIGQAGVQIGESFWNQLSLEHGISVDGHDKMNNNGFFFETCKNKWVPIAIFIDLEPLVINEIRTGEFKEFFSPDSFITGNESSSNIWAKGMYSVGKQIIEKSLERIRKIAEACQNLQGFIFFHSICGGCGSGFANLLLTQIQKDYGKTSKLSFTIFPSPTTSAGVLEVYNSVLATEMLMDLVNVTIMMDNEAMYNICKKELDLEYITYHNLNSMICQVSSAITSQMRFGGSLNQNLLEIQTNLVPFKRTHFLLCSQSPIVSPYSQYSTYEITNHVFNQFMLSCDQNAHKFMACTLLYNGDVLKRDVNIALDKLIFKNHFEFVDWVPTGFKIGINHHQPIVYQGKESFKTNRIACLISNSYAVNFSFNKLAQKFDLMYQKRDHVWLYCAEGMDEYEFCHARECFDILQKDYECGFIEDSDCYQ